MLLGKKWQVKTELGKMLLGKMLLGKMLLGKKWQVKTELVNHIPQISPVVKVVSDKLYLRWIYFVHSPNQTLPRILHKRKQQPHGANKTLSALKEPI